MLKCSRKGEKTNNTKAKNYFGEAYFAAHSVVEYQSHITKILTNSAIQ